MASDDGLLRMGASIVVVTATSAGSGEALADVV